MACKYEEICNLPSVATSHGFCLLHDPNPKKGIPTFRRALEDYIKNGGSNFQFMFLPGFDGTFFQGRTFLNLVDFSHAIFPNGLFLNKANLEQGLKIEADEIQTIQLLETTIQGNTQIVAERNLANFQTINAKFHGDLSINFENGSHINLGGEFLGDVKIRGTVQRDLHVLGAKFHKSFCLSTCQVNTLPTFENVTWEPSSNLNLSKANLTHGIVLEVPNCPPKIDITNTGFQKNVTIEQAPGKPFTLIVSNPTPPIFKGSDVIFRNVDLSYCMLLANDMSKIAFVNVKWPKWHGRICLFDEMYFRSFRIYLELIKPKTWDYAVESWPKIWAQKHFFHSILKEHYQSLKQMYLDRGDHQRSGDFHYGEMEMKRREYGWPSRILCLEFVYWALSGYGTRPLRAFMVLGLICLMSAWGYLSLSPNSFCCDFLEGLQFSLKVMTFQRPEIPFPFPSLAEPAQWLKIFQTILGPVQIALFGLSLRMRLKR